MSVKEEVADWLGLSTYRHSCFLDFFGFSMCCLASTVSPERQSSLYRLRLHSEKGLMQDC